MPQKISIGYVLEAAAGEEGRVSIYKVPGARKLRNVLFCIHFPSGTDGDLMVAAYVGNQKVLPREGYYYGDGTKWQDDSEAVWPSDSDVVIYYKNLNTTATKKAYILMIGELE